MGNPVHYSLELPQRCLQLVDELWPHAEKVLQEDRPDLGALTTTFLISMSMPIVNLPIERIERNLRTESDGYADDRHIDPAISKAVEQVLGGQEFRSAPFYVPDAWSFANCTHEELFNIAGGIPDRLTTELGTGEAVASAGKLPTSQWCSILRNAMAHGGVVYLDKRGRTSYDGSVSMYAFVSGKFDDAGRLAGLNLLRVSEADYRIFLRKWVDWLQSSGASKLAA